jgi:hypothetical protein
MDTLEQVFTANALRDSASHLVSEEAIRQRAYEIYARRGMQSGRADEDWFEAETELRNEAQEQQQSWT